MLVDNRFHLTYCTNVHTAESWKETFTLLKNFLPQIKKSVSTNEKFGVGLYLSNRASSEILEKDELKKFKNWLDENDLYVFTMNGFPYGGFHEQRVKENVYKPDWTKPERLEYTKRLFKILAELLPDGFDGGISTCPISYKHWWKKDKVEAVFSKTPTYFAEVAFFLSELSNGHQKKFHLDIEPEPDCLLENVEDTVNFFSKYLIPKGSEWLQQNKKISASEADKIIRKHIGVCYDVCHFAVEFEDQKETIAALIANGIRIGKVQASAALKATFSEKGYGVLQELSQFQEERYLHQTVKRNKDGSLKKFSDLPQALSDENSEVDEIRSHFHVPLFLDRYKNLKTTQDDVRQVLEMLKTQHFTNHVEVETYTWDVLPDDLKKDLSESIARELKWVKKMFE